MRIIEDQGEVFYYDPQVDKAIDVYESAYDRYKIARNKKYAEMFGEFSQAWKKVFSQCSMDSDIVNLDHLKKITLSWIHTDWDYIWHWDLGAPGRIDMAEIASANWSRWEREFKNRHQNWETYIIKMVVEPDDGIEFKPIRDL